MRPDTRQEIEQVAARLLAKAGAAGRVPTPMDDVLAVAGLGEPRDSLLAPAQLARAPAAIRSVIAKLTGKVLGLLDRRAREVHLDPTVSQESRRRFVKGHEIMHHALPWQRDLVYADDAYRLAASVRLQFELEASQGAAELLYQSDRFTRDAADMQIGMAAVVSAAQRYRVSIESGLWRYVETNAQPLLAVVLDPSPISQEPLRYKRRQLVRSMSFGERFGKGIWPGQLAISQYSFLAEASAATLSRVVVPGEWVRSDLAGKSVMLRTECFATGYAILVLIWVPEKVGWLRRKAKLVA